MCGKSVINNLKIIFLVLLLAMPLCEVAAQRSSRRPAAQASSKNQIGIVISQEAAVYQRPDFDSPVVGSVQEKQQLPMSNRKFKTSDEFGAFFKVKLPDGRVGYLADNDIQPLKLKKKFDDEMESQGDGESLYFKKMVGVSLASVKYAEKFQGRTSSAQSTLIGFRATGPDIIGDSPPLDLNIMLGFKPPSYYDSMSSGSSGFFLLGDLGVVFPLIDWDKSLLNFGLGVMWTYTHFSVPLAGKTYSSDELRLGIDLGFGGAVRFDSFVLRGDVKYFIEKTQYAGLMLSLQKIY